jgi:molybdate transport system substrate-binding protein
MGTLLGATACSQLSSEAAEPQRSIMVFTAPALTDAFAVIADQFEATYPGTQINFSIAPSEELAEQIREGAAADVFAAAHSRHMNDLIQSGHVAMGAERIFARNRLVIVTPPGNLAGLEDFRDLAEPGMRIAFADEELLVGAYSGDFLAKAEQDLELGPSFHEAVLANVVSVNPSVSAVLNEVQMRQVDAGIVYESDVAEERYEKLERLEIPPELNTVADYKIAALTTASDEELAARFVEYVLSAEGQAVLEEHGFMVIN